MSIWIRRIFSLAIAVLKTKASIYQTVPGDSFISRTPLSSSEFELENLRRPSKSKRKFGDFFSEESQDGQNMNQKSWSETEPSRGLHSLDFTYSHLERSGDNYNPTAWNTQHENIPGDFKLLYPTNHPYSSRSEFEDLEDLGSFSQNSDFWNTFIEKLQPETAHDQDEIHKNKEAEKNLSALALQNTVSRSNLKTKKKKTHNPFDEYNLKRQLKKMMAYKVPDPSSSIEENHIEKYLDKIFNVENEEKILAHDKNLNVNEEANLIHEPKSDFEVFHKGRNFDSKTLQETKGPPIYGIFGLEQRKNGVNKEIDVSENRRTSHKSHRASPAVNKDRGTSKKRTSLQKGSRAYERQRLEDCLDDFYKTKLEENVIFGGKDNKKQFSERIEELCRRIFTNKELCPKSKK
ncbi:hypothetical protein BY996DRAFT_6425569 [Phakopsora pachyrhizi]|nr:hypothetical protein BY996DRAFT_6425569 [Phakopsora pachyrhizi]